MVPLSNVIGVQTQWAVLISDQLRVLAAGSKLEGYTALTTRQNESSENVLKRFLENPTDRKSFDEFFLLCYRLVRGYLGHLRGQGWRLPFDLTSDRDQIGDLAIDVLGPILAGPPGQPCQRLRDRLAKTETYLILDVPSDKQYGIFTAQLFLLAREELRSIRRDMDPQVEHLKRRFSDTLSEAEFLSFSDDGSRTTFVCLASSEIRNSEHLPLLSGDDLERIVEKAYHLSQTRSQWCRNILELVEQRHGFRKCVVKHDLLRAAVNVNIRYLRDEALLPRVPSSADADLMVADAEEVKLRTIECLKRNVVSGYVRRQSISETVGERYLEAADLYLSDMVYSREVDKLPVYFREVMPQEEHKSYLKTYKHTFETTMNRAEAEFRKRLRKRL